MASNWLKKHLGKSLEVLTANRADSRQFMEGRALPCTVVRVVSSGIVEVNFEVDAAPITLPNVTVPILHPEYIRYPIQVGDKGVTVPFHARLGNATGQGGGVPKLLDRPGNMTALAFLWHGSTKWTAPIDANATEIYGPEGVIIRGAASETIIRVQDGGVTITLGGPCAINSGGHNVTLSGGGDIIAGSISLLNHTHGGVQTGSGESMGPQG